MAVFRIEKTKDYTIMSNHHLRNKSLSLKAKGLQSLMLSLPENWDFTLAGLAYICQDGIGSVRSGVAELEEQGYLTRRRIREANGQLSDIEYTIHEIPHKPEPADSGDPDGEPVDNSPPVCKKPTSQKPICENPTLAAPTYGNSTQLSNTSNSKRIKSNTDLSTIHQSIDGAPDYSALSLHESRPAGVRESSRCEMDSMDIYRDILKENIEYDTLCQQYKHSGEEINEILELMLETVCSTKKTIRIGGEDKPAELVKSRMLKVGQFEIEYVMECLSKNTTEVRNIRSYLLTTLYNAPGTIGNYYKAMVQHDLYGDKQ